jgi:hypothetical protein
VPQYGLDVANQPARAANAQQLGTETANSDGNERSTENEKQLDVRIPRETRVKG